MKKLIEYGSIKEKEEGKIIDDQADEDASIKYKTIQTLFKYYGHWY